MDGQGRPYTVPELEAWAAAAGYLAVLLDAAWTSPVDVSLAVPMEGVPMPLLPAPIWGQVVALAVADLERDGTDVWDDLIVALRVQAQESARMAADLAADDSPTA